MKTQKHFFLLIFLITLLTGCFDDRDSLFYGDWRENLGSGKITFKKNKDLIYFGKKGTWKHKWTTKKSCTWCGKAGTLSLDIPGEKIELSFSFLHSQDGKNDNKLLVLTGKDGKRFYYTKGELSKSKFPNTLPSGWALEDQGLHKYVRVNHMAFTDNNTFAMVEVQYSQSATTLEIFKKDAGKWSKLKVGSFVVRPMTFTHFDSIQAYGKKLLVTTSNNRIFFSDNEGESFKEVQNQGRLNFSGSIAFKGDFYVGVRSSRGTGANQVQVLEVHKMSSFENQNSSHWKKTLSIDIQSASLSFASDGKYLFAAAGKKLYKSLDGESWSNVSPSSFWGESSDFNFILSSNKGLVVGYSSTKDQKIYSADSNGFWSHAFSHAYTWYNGINTDGTNIYFNDEATGQGLYVTIGSSSTSKKLVEFKHPSRHSFKLFSGNGRYFVASSQGFFSRFW